MSSVTMLPIIRTNRTIEYGPLISPVRDRDKPVYNWHAFKHSYSKDLVKKLIKRFDLKKGSWVLDPFCGGGITLLACKEMGINSQGFDIMPFSAFLSNVKTRNYKSLNLRKDLKRFYKKISHADIGQDLPSIKIIHEAFSPRVKQEILSLRQEINKISNKKTRDFYMLGLLSILESVSNTSKAGGFLRIDKKRVGKDEVQKKFLSRIEKMIEDVENFDTSPEFSGAKTVVNLSDARALKTKRKFDSIITSPPYPNRHDYTRIYSLELIVGFLKTHKELKDVRYNTLRSHVEAKKQFQALNYKKPKKIDVLISKVKKAGLNNRRVPEMIEGYFEDMYLSLLQMRRSLKKGGKLGLVVSNVRFGGVGIPVDTILAEIGEQAGLTIEDVIIARYRGNSAQQMKEFKRQPTIESIIIWSNPN